MDNFHPSMSTFRFTLHVFLNRSFQKTLKMHGNGHLNDFAFYFFFEQKTGNIERGKRERERERDREKARESYLVHVLVFYVLNFDR